MANIFQKSLQGLQDWLNTAQGRALESGQQPYDIGVPGTTPPPAGGYPATTAAPKEHPVFGAWKPGAGTPLHPYDVSVPGAPVPTNATPGAPQQTSGMVWDPATQSVLRKPAPAGQQYGAEPS